MAKQRRALVSGITGQDGSYLTELLIEKGYEVHGIIRRSSLFKTDRIDHLNLDPNIGGVDLHLYYGDMTDGTSLRRIFDKVRPHEVYNLGAQSHVQVSFEQPEYTVQVDALGTLLMLEALREYNLSTGENARYYQASSSEMFGKVFETPQTEKTPFYPRSTYGCAKVYSFWQTVNYREAYGIYAVNGILFNHESPRRGETFVSRKVTRGATRIKEGLQEKIYLGNLEARRDWGFAGDFVEAMWLMLQQDSPEDFVIATGEMHSVQELIEEVFSLLDLDWRDHVEVSERYFRPSEVDHLLGDASKARSMLGWNPGVSFGELIAMMVESDLELARQERVLRDAGHEVKAPYYHE